MASLVTVLALLLPSYLQSNGWDVHFAVICVGLWTPWALWSIWALVARCGQHSQADEGAFPPLTVPPTTTRSAASVTASILFARHHASRVFLWSHTPSVCGEIDCFN
jgi:hypothetical protein